MVLLMLLFLEGLLKQPRIKICIASSLIVIIAITAHEKLLIEFFDVWVYMHLHAHDTNIIRRSFTLALAQSAINISLITTSRVPLIRPDLSSSHTSSLITITLSPTDICVSNSLLLLSIYWAVHCQENLMASRLLH